MQRETKRDITNLNVYLGATNRHPASESSTTSKVSTLRAYAMASWTEGVLRRRCIPCVRQNTPRTVSVGMGSQGPPFEKAYVASAGGEAVRVVRGESDGEVEVEQENHALSLVLKFNISRLRASKRAVEEVFIIRNGCLNRRSVVFDTISELHGSAG